MQRRSLWKIGGIMAVLLGMTAGCSNIDCPLDNVVAMQCNLYSANDKSAYTLAENESLTIMPLGRDTILLNSASNVSSFLLPLKETEQNDTLLCYFANTDGQEAADTLYIDHTLQPHFESLDCPAAVFHTLTQVRATSHPVALMPLTIDSVSIVRSIVNYDDVENIRIYLRSTDK